MSGTRAGGWIAGTVVLVLAIFAATWFLLVGPKFDEAAVTMFQAQDTRSQNELLVLQNAKLKSDFENLETFKTELAALHEQIPTTAGLASFTRTIGDLATEHGVFVMGVSPGLPVAVTVPTPPPAPVDPAAPAPGSEQEVDTDGGEKGDVTDVTTGTVTEPSVPEQIPGLVAVPLQVTVVGSYSNVSAFLGGVQTGQDRLFLVTALDGTQQDAQDAVGAKPAIAAGDLELTITGYMYVLQDPTAPLPSVEDPEAPVAPLPASDRNPFAPLD